MDHDELPLRFLIFDFVRSAGSGSPASRANAFGNCVGFLVPAAASWSGLKGRTLRSSAILMEAGKVAVYCRMARCGLGRRSTYSRSQTTRRPSH